MLKNNFFLLALCLTITVCYADFYGHPYAVIYPPPGLRSNINGPGIDPAGNVYVGSNTAETVVKVDLVTGALQTFIDLPLGSSDDCAFRSDGTFAWNSLLDFQTHVRKPDGTIILVADGIPFPNGIAWAPNGDLYMSTDPVGTGLYKLDPTGVNAPINVLNLTGSMNGFQFGPDGKIYGPIDTISPPIVVQIDVHTLQVRTFSSDNWINPEGVRVAADGTVYVLDDATATVYRVNSATGTKTAVVSVPEPAYLDNFRILHDSLVISNSVTNSLILYNMTTSKLRHVTPNTPLCLPGGISYFGGILYIADYSVMHNYNPATGVIVSTGRSGPQPAPDPNISFGLYNVFVNRRYAIYACPFDGRVQLRNLSTNQAVGQVPAGWPYGVAMSRDFSTLLVADYGTGLTVWTGAGYQTGRTLNTGIHVGFTGLALGEGCFVYASDYDNGAILKINYETGQYTVVASGLSLPEGLALDVDIEGSFLIVAEVGAKRIISINTQTGAINVIANNLPIGGLPAPLALPPPNILTGIALNDNGDIYFTSDIQNALYVIRKY